MNTRTSKESAKIYQFPVGGRAALAVRRQEEIKPAIDQDRPRVNDVACSESWYHEAAIREAALKRDR